jgi:hypothetical protein
MQESNPLRSVAAIIVGFLAVVVLSLCTDQLLHVLKVYPPWGDPMPQPGLNALALSYRIVFTIFGSYLAARIAPRNPMRHALILGFIGLVLGLLAPLPRFLCISARRGIPSRSRPPPCPAPGSAAYWFAANKRTA